MNNILNSYHEKFKTNHIIIRYYKEASKSEISKAALLAMYLTHSNNKYNTYKSASDNLDRLYGTKVNAGVSIKGKYVVIDFNIHFVSNRYLQDETYLKQVIDSYLDYIKNPFVVDNAFDLKTFTLKKNDLIQRIKATYDDKSSYATDRFYEYFGKGYPLEINTMGYLEDINKITNKSLYDFYLDFIKDNYIVSINIDQKDDVINEILSKQYPLLNVDINKMHYQLELKEYEEVIEKQDIKQSKLLVGYVSNKTFENDYYKKLVFNTLFGMSSNSYLFKIVREKNHLCYSVRSNYDQYSDTLVVSSGINYSDYQKTTQIINDILKDMSNNLITEEDLNDAKTTLKDIIYKTLDSQPTYNNYCLNRYVQKMSYNIEDDIKMIDMVSIKDLKQLASSFKLQLTYLLGGTNNE